MVLRGRFYNCSSGRRTGGLDAANITTRHWTQLWVSATYSPSSQPTPKQSSCICQNSELHNNIYTGKSTWMWFSNYIWGLQGVKCELNRFWSVYTLIFLKQRCRCSKLKNEICLPTYIFKSDANLNFFCDFNIFCKLCTGK